MSASPDPRHSGAQPWNTANSNSDETHPIESTDRDSGARAVRSDRDTVIAREKDRYGGIKWGSAFSGG